MPSPLTGHYRPPLIAVVALCCTLGNAAAQDGATRIIDPRPYGIELPPGRLTPGDGRSVTTLDASGQPTIGRIHCQIGEGAVVLLSDGQLVVRQPAQFSPTERKFQPIAKDDLAKALAAEFPGFKTRATNHYVYVYDCSEEFALGTSRILESMLPGVKDYAELSRISVHNPKTPLVAVMFRTRADFQRHRRVPDGVVAYYDSLSNRIVMHEQSRLFQVRPDLAIQQAISTIAHEGAHQILHNIGVQQRLSLWPMWLSEGLAEFFAPTTVSARLRWKGAGQINDLRMVELEQYLASGGRTLPEVGERSPANADGELVEHTVLAARLSSTGYASAWALTHYLAKNRRSEFNDFLRQVSRLGPFEGTAEVLPPGIVRGNRDQFARHFGDDFKELEARLIGYLQKQPYTNPFINPPPITRGPR